MALDYQYHSTLPCTMLRLHGLPGAQQNWALSQSHTKEPPCSYLEPAGGPRSYKTLLSRKKSTCDSSSVLSTILPTPSCPAMPLQNLRLNYKLVMFFLLLQCGAQRMLNEGVRDSKWVLLISKKLHNSAAATSSPSPHLCDKSCILQAFVKELILQGAGCPLYL